MASEKRIIISARLQVIADMVPDGSRVADIGTDHGYLPIWLLQNKDILFALACDVNEGPLDHAKRSATQYGVLDSMTFRLGNGLSCIAPEEVDTIIIAGMGGETIISILEAAPWVNASAYRLILQPMTKAELLRPWLAQNGYRFLSEQLVYENHTYFPVMEISGGAKAAELTPGQIWGGVKLCHDPLQGDALDKLIKQLGLACSGLEKSSIPENKEKAEHHRSLIAQLQTMKEAWIHANSEGN